MYTCVDDIGSNNYDYYYDYDKHDQIVSEK